MASIKALDRISAKWSRVTQAATQSYTEGVENPGTDWATATAAAEKNYNAGVQAAVSRGGFGKGVRRAGSAKWKAAALDKGAQRFGQGVALAQVAYETGFAPYRTVIANLVLSPRGPKGDPSNIQRVTQIATALRQEKLRRLGA